ncbi:MULTISPECIES: TetR family transcriptional regulator [Streptomyces]|jgi:AcrR family transcriptional regulator|uniref:AcrR family transcriptional regulator n=2 Tax=Streptomyces TaxID=1883 RepID=A0A514JXL5_9ACTN|nr:TetR family transcriptional regulator [Streptomyces calvus]MBA8942902.1 AcrR family transcriptional regulator [Streptomyces calvus]MBA8978580.1 AcrR family transcriptional regulator [Streptomyces calvus]QDI71288.1 TetR family transcriptional regulator [Streptomyces calvus]GGP33969.1 TetR family transcriptional regulator [Streptomyces calvus]
METVGTVVGAPPRPGLRERKKQRTRDALVRTALELIATRGYEGTTVDDIAEAVDVSQRTFFRYFASKEEVALFVPRLAESHVVDAVHRRPPDEVPLEALRRAVLDSWDGITEAVERLVPLELHMRVYRVIESTPALLAAHLRRATELEEELARIIAEREGLDVDADPRPRILLAAFGGVVRVAERQWSTGDDFGVDAMRELLATYLDHLGPALAGNWRTE